MWLLKTRYGLLDTCVYNWTYRGLGACTLSETDTWIERVIIPFGLSQHVFKSDFFLKLKIHFSTKSKVAINWQVGYEIKNVNVLMYLRYVRYR